MNRVRIESDGTPAGTRITFGGEPIRGVRSVSWHADAHDRSVACLEIIGAQLEVDIPAGDVVVVGRRESEDRPPAGCRRRLRARWRRVKGRRTPA